jgi:hypothetical protein
MEAIIEEIAKEVSIYFILGTVVKDLVKNDLYEIKSFDKKGILLEHKPHFRGEQKNDLPIGYDELVMAFSKDRFFISGFSTVVEGGNKHDLEKLKRAIKDTREKIELEERTIEAKRLADAQARLSLKRRTKRAVRNTRVELEFREKEEAERLRKEKEELDARLAQEENERLAKIAKEEEERLAKIAKEKKIKILNKKRASMQMRFRLFKKQF